MKFHRLLSFLQLATLVFGTPKTSKFFQFPQNGSWIQAIAVRNSSGELLVTRADVAELWSIHPDTKASRRVCSFENVTSMTGITEVETDLFAVAGIKFNVTTDDITPGSGVIFTVDLRNNTTPTAKTVQYIPETLFLNGLTTFDGDQGIILAAESGLGLIYQVNIHTGNYSIVSNDTLLGVVPGSNPIGVNGLKMHGSDVYFTSSSGMILGRAPLTNNATLAGPVEIVANVSSFLHDFTLAPDATAYLAASFNNIIIKVTPSGSFSTIAGAPDSTELQGITSLAFRRWSTYSTLYATTDGQNNSMFVEPAKVIRVKLYG
jgi:hypothetical protein